MKPYYQFWLEGEQLADDHDLPKLIKYVSEELSSGNWQLGSDFQFVKCEPIEVYLTVDFKIKEKE